MESKASAFGREKATEGLQRTGNGTAQDQTNRSHVIAATFIWDQPSGRVSVSASCCRAPKEIVEDFERQNKRSRWSFNKRKGFILGQPQRLRESYGLITRGSTWYLSSSTVRVARTRPVKAITTNLWRSNASAINTRRTSERERRKSLKLSGRNTLWSDQEGQALFEIHFWELWESPRLWQIGTKKGSPLGTALHLLSSASLLAARTHLQREGQDHQLFNSPPSQYA